MSLSSHTDSQSSTPLVGRLVDDNAAADRNMQQSGATSDSIVEYRRAVDALLYAITSQTLQSAEFSAGLLGGYRLGRQ